MTKQELNTLWELACKLRKERLDLEIHVCKLRLWLAEFEKARQLEK